MGYNPREPRKPNGEWTSGGVTNATKAGRKKLAGSGTTAGVASAIAGVDSALAANKAKQAALAEKMKADKELIARLTSKNKKK